MFREGKQLAFNVTTNLAIIYCALFHTGLNYKTRTKAKTKTKTKQDKTKHNTTQHNKKRATTRAQ